MKEKNAEFQKLTNAAKVIIFQFQNLHNTNSLTILIENLKIFRIPDDTL